MRFVICVSLRMAASAEAPLSPIALPERLQRVGKVGRAREQACQRALTEKRTLRGGGALQVLDLRLFEDGSERGGTLESDAVAIETASDGWWRWESRRACQRALTGRQTLGSWFER